MNAADISDVSIVEVSYDRDGVFEWFFIGSMAKLAECERMGEHYGICFNMSRKEFCDITEKFLSKNKEPCSSNDCEFFILTTRRHNTKEVRLVCSRGVVSVTIGIFIRGAWALCPDIAIKWLNSFRNVKGAVGIGESEFDDLMKDIESEVAK